MRVNKISNKIYLFDRINRRLRRRYKNSLIVIHFNPIRIFLIIHKIIKLIALKVSDNY